MFCPLAARTYGLAAVACYEAVVLGSRTHQPLGGQLNGWPPDKDNPPATALMALLSYAIPGLAGTMGTGAPLGTAEGSVFLSRWLDWPTAANSTLARVLHGLFPTPSPASLAALTATEQAFASEALARVPKHVYALSVVWGHVVAEAVLAWSRTDGFRCSTTVLTPRRWGPASGSQPPRLHAALAALLGPAAPPSVDLR